MAFSLLRYLPIGHYWKNPLQPDLELRFRDDLEYTDFFLCLLKHRTVMWMWLNIWMLGDTNTLRSIKHNYSLVPCTKQTQAFQTWLIAISPCSHEAAVTVVTTSHRMPINIFSTLVQDICSKRHDRNEPRKNARAQLGRHFRFCVCMCWVFGSVWFLTWKTLMKSKTHQL